MYTRTSLKKFTVKTTIGKTEIFYRFFSTPQNYGNGSFFTGVENLRLEKVINKKNSLLSPFILRN